MYGYYEHSNISPEQLLQKIDQRKVFELVLNKPFDINEKYTSPFRNDTNAGCFFAKREDGTIIFVDFGEMKGNRHRSCFRMVMDMYNISLVDTINFICSKFNLSKNSIDYAPVDKIEYKKQDNEETVITYTSKQFTKKDKLYWSQFLIKINELVEDNVFSVQRFTKINRKGRLISTPYNECYAIDFVNHVKIYMPNNNPKYKWISNCDEDDIGNIDNLPATGDKLIITKSYKDHRVFKNLLNTKSIVWFQNEGCVPSEYILFNLLSRFTIIYIFFDNDIAGFKAAYKLYKIFSKINDKVIIKIKYIPIKYQQKDIAEYIYKEGRVDTLKLLKQLKL